MHLGLMLFNSGEVYLGYFDKDLYFQGEGMFFFTIGAFVWGNFEKGKLNGFALLTIPNDINLLAKFNKGNLT